MLPVLLHALVNVHETLHPCVVVVYDLLVVLNVLHPILVAGIDVDSWVVYLVDFVLVIIEVAEGII